MSSLVFEILVRFSDRARRKYPVVYRSHLEKMAEMEAMLYTNIKQEGLNLLNPNLSPFAEIDIISQ